MQFENIAFEGGGIRGYSYIGVLKALNEEESILNIKKVIGTSVGSIFALFVACKVSNSDLDKYSTTLFNQLTNLKHDYLSQIIKFFEYTGLYDNVNVYNAINLLLKERYNISNITFEQLFNITNIELTVVGTCITTETIEYFNHKTHPNMEIAKAIQISTAIPFFYTVVDWNGSKWIDGGAVSNFPINYYDFDNGEYNKKTLGICLNNNKPIHNEKISVINLLDYIEDTELNINFKDNVGNIKNRNLIMIDTGNINFLNFNISQIDKDLLINNGFNTTKTYFLKYF